jgi:ech hydrogenase subunit E
MTAVGASKTYTIPVGPLHVALEEPMYFHIDVEGETVREVDIRVGHVHRGVEYLTTKRSIYQNVVLTERTTACASTCRRWSAATCGRGR